MAPEVAVWCLTGQIADWYDIDTGKLQVGAQADIAVLDPKAWKAAKLMAYAEETFEAMGSMKRVVNRNDGIVKATIMHG